MPGNSGSNEKTIEVDYESVLDDLLPGDVIPLVMVKLW